MLLYLAVSKSFRENGASCAALALPDLNAHLAGFIGEVLADAGSRKSDDADG